VTVNQAALLKDLRRQVTVLEDDLRDRTESEPEYRDALRAEYDRARQAQRTATTYGPWRDDRVTQAAVAWVLATVFVRFCEDNGMIADPWIAGPGELLVVADERHQAFFRQHPEKNDRDWLIAAFDHLADTNDTVAGLFDRDHNPLWELKPSYEAASELLKFWRRVGPDGAIVHDFTDPELETRFLGDLYQNLSTHAQKTYALLQTPEFVEEFILDLTLEPAVQEFGLEPAWKYRSKGWPGDAGEPVRGLRTIDPACGSGHFLLGIFKRLLAAWNKEAPKLDKWDRIRRTLESIHGCDKNPFAAEIARFRLMVAALKAAEETRLDRAPVFPINVAVGDSLLHGRGIENRTAKLFGEETAFRYRSEDVDEYANRCDLLGIHSYHVVVGNPPYIAVKDKGENKSYREYESVGGAYALSVPFAERIFELAIRTGASDRAAGFTGQITANSFMKREFGKKLIDWFHRKVDLTYVVDTSGAFIPGHGTPTVILIGRNRYAFKSSTVRVVQSVRGEPSQPENPANGQVWQAIADQVSRPGSDSQWVTVVDLDRSKLAFHPWTLAGGGAAELLSVIEGQVARLGDHVTEIGRTTHTGLDDAFYLPLSAASRLNLSELSVPIVRGDDVREFVVRSTDVTIFPYDGKGEARPVALSESKLLWINRTALRERVDFGKSPQDRGLRWFDHSMFFPRRFAIPSSITYGEVATHNHFAFDRGGRVFTQTAPAIKLPEGASEDEHLRLFGLLNSSTACFWLKQVSHDKGIRGEGGGFTSSEWERFYQFNATKLEKFPIPGERPSELAKILDASAARLASFAPETLANTELPNPNRLSSAQRSYEQVRTTMIAAQEELDWQVYGLYGLLDEAARSNVLMPDVHELPPVELGQRAFEIVLARRINDGEADDEWFRRHGSKPVTQIPEHWPEEYRRVVQARIDLIEKRSKDIGLLERPEYKRRWADESWEKKERAALRTWILERCEREAIWFAMRDGFRQPRTLTIAQLADRFSSDEGMQSVAALYAADHMGKSDVPLETVLAEIIGDQHVPYLAALRYTDTGLRKRAEWEQVWEQQREEDRTGKRLDIAVPPKYNDKDFRVKSYWSQRGKLDVPKERFISYPGASPETDGTLLLGWAGWDHKDQAQALVNIVNDRTEQAGWETEKIRPLLAGLLEVMPWVHQWHGEYDDDWEGIPAEEFQTFLNQQRAKHQLSEQDLRGWRSEEPKRGRRKKAN
jgi:hypothetical protein